MGNGNEASGDGWRYRGKGAIQLTGHDTTKAFADSQHMTLPDALAFLETPRGAVLSAGWFWSTHGLNALADQNKFKEITKAINGGYNGLEDRTAIYEKALRLIA